MKKKIAFAIVTIAAVATLVGCGNKEYVTLGDYSAITIEIDPKEEVTNEDVEAKYQEVLDANMSYETITGRTAESGDLVEIDYVGTVDGEEFDSGTIGADGDDFLLGSDTMIEGFEEAIIGMSIGEEKIAEITFPEDYYSEDLSGKLAQFDITLNAIKKAVYPEELTEEMIMAVNPDCTTEEELRAAFRLELEEAVDAAYLEAQKSAIIYNLVESATYADELPEEMLTEYEDMLVDQTEQWAAAYGVDLETLVSSYFYQTMDEFYADTEEQAILYAKQELLMDALAEAEGIEVSSEDITAYAEEIYLDYGYESAEVFIEAYGEDAFISAIEADRVFDILLANTTTNDLVVETAE
jgi:trigger factor